MAKVAECPVCGKGGFKTSPGLAGHIRLAHDTYIPVGKRAALRPPEADILTSPPSPEELGMLAGAEDAAPDTEVAHAPPVQLPIKPQAEAPSDPQTAVSTTANAPAREMAAVNAGKRYRPQGPVQPGSFVRVVPRSFIMTSDTLWTARMVTEQQWGWRHIPDEGQWLDVFIREVFLERGIVLNGYSVMTDEEFEAFNTARVQSGESQPAPEPEKNGASTPSKKEKQSA